MHETQVKPHLQCGTDPTMIRPWSEHDPTTHETVSQPSHRRGRSSRFGDGLCMEKHRVSCICYLSQTHFVRDILQNSISCNPTLSLTNSFQLLHQHHLQAHLQWGNDPRVANHNGIPSATHPPAPLAIPFTFLQNSVDRKSGETPFTMRNRSNHDPPMIRTWSDHTRDRLATVAPQR